jgi:hypothetical protein
MKLRIKGNSIRLRLTKSEVETFGADGHIEEMVNFGDKEHPGFVYALESGSTQNLSASFEEGRLSVQVPETIATQWVNSEEVGFNGNDGDLQILVEKDFVCLTPREGEDEGDNYPHPNSEDSC